MAEKICSTAANFAPPGVTKQASETLEALRGALAASCSLEGACLLAEACTELNCSLDDEFDAIHAAAKQRNGLLSKKDTSRRLELLTFQESVLKAQLDACKSTQEVYPAAKAAFGSLFQVVPEFERLLGPDEAPEVGPYVTFRSLAQNRVIQTCLPPLMTSACAVQAATLEALSRRALELGISFAES